MDLEKIERGVKLILEGIGDNPDRPGLLETPARVAKMYTEICSGIEETPEDYLKIIEGENHDEIVFLKDIPMFSICEHHLLPFQGLAHIAYIPRNGRIVGLSKIVRVLNACAKRPQVQERLTTQVADVLMKGLDPKGVMVMIEASHLCMTIRGVKAPNSSVTTSVVRGIFRKSQLTRSEALALFKK